MNRSAAWTARAVIASQYFLYFGVLGIFLPYFNLYCYHLDFSGLQIGVLSAARSVVLVMVPLGWGALADRYGVRRPLYVFCSVAAALLWSLYLLTTDFVAMLAITVAYAVFYSPIISFLEAFTMDVLGERKRRYGRIRVWGSVSFITVVLLLGKIIDVYGLAIIVALILGGSALQAVIAFRIPRAQPRPDRSLTSGAAGLLRKRVVVFLICAFLMLCSHGAYYGFFSIHLENLGFGSIFIGVAWALASTAEISVMLTSERIFKRFSCQQVLLFSFGVAVLRWLIVFVVRSPATILLSQLLHAVTYGTFHMASILYIDALSPDESKTLGQAANNALTYGLGLAVGFFVNGALYEPLGSAMLFVISAGMALAAGIIFALFENGRFLGLSRHAGGG